MGGLWEDGAQRGLAAPPDLVAVSLRVAGPRAWESPRDTRQGLSPAEHRQPRVGTSALDPTLVAQTPSAHLKPRFSSGVWVLPENRQSPYRASVVSAVPTTLWQEEGERREEGPCRTLVKGWGLLSLFFFFQCTKSRLLSHYQQDGLPSLSPLSFP